MIFSLRLTESLVHRSTRKKSADGYRTYVRFEGKNQAECDAKAIEYFEMQTAKLNYDEIAAFIQYPEDFFVNYRIVSATHAEGQEGRILGSWIYPPAK